jgi:hypothetical protein
LISIPQASTGVLPLSPCKKSFGNKKGTGSVVIAGGFLDLLGKQIKPREEKSKEGKT